MWVRSFADLFNSQHVLHTKADVLSFGDLVSVGLKLALLERLNVAAFEKSMEKSGFKDCKHRGSVSSFCCVGTAALDC